MNAPAHTIRDESRWPPALVILAVVFLVATLPGHVHVVPVWVSCVAAFAAIAPMAAVGLTGGNTRWLRIERVMIILLATAYVANIIAEVADLIGLITLHPSGNNAFSLLSSSVTIWVTNVLTFSLLFWQIDQDGPSARASGPKVRPDWDFLQPAKPEDLPADWRPLFLDYLFLGYSTATAFSPTQDMPITRRAKMLMMIESTSRF